MKRANSGSFVKGLVPWNKGLKGIHLSPNSEFKLGNPDSRVFIRHLPAGSITRRTDKNGRERQFIKVDRRWVEYANHLWVVNYGPLIPGDVVHHLDGDYVNDTLSNLIALPRGIHVRYHGRWGLKAIPTDVLIELVGRYVPG